MDFPSFVDRRACRIRHDGKTLHQQLTVGWMSPGSSGISNKRDAFTITRAVSGATPPSTVMRSAVVSGHFLHLYGQFAEE